MKKQRILNASETRTEDVLRVSLAGSGYRVFARLPLGKVIQREQHESLPQSDRKFLLASELDFVVANAESVPEFVVEFDGPCHRSDEKQAARDVRKNRLCSLAELPLWRITDTELAEFDKCTILEFIIRRFLAWRRDSEDISKQIDEYWSALDKDQQQVLIADPTGGVILDPSVHFDIAHPFPRTREVAKRLLEEHGIVSLLAEPSLTSASLQQARRLFCDVFAPSRVTSDGHDFVTRSDYVVSRSQEPFHGTKTIASEPDRKSSKILKRGFLEFRIRGSLPIVPDYDPAEPPIEYFMRTGNMPVSLPELPGVTPHDVGDAVSEYLGFRAVEEWARENGQELQSASAIA